MKDSRKDKRDGEKRLSTPNQHVDGGNGKKAIVYNTKEEKKGRGTERKDERNMTERKDERNIGERKTREI